MSGTPDRPKHEPAEAGRQSLERLSRRLYDAAAGVFPSGRPWSLVDYPMHYNCGDAALFLGAVALARGCGTRVVQVLDRRSYSPGRLHPDTVVVIQAGGNWGGLYQTHHNLRLRVLEDRDRPVVQLPQSVEYATPEHREQLQRAVSAHRDFTLLVRDQRSFDLATRDFDCPVLLVPDTVFALGPLRRDAPSVELVVQGRTDKESASNQLAESFAAEHGATVTDWLETGEVRPRTAFALATRVNALQRRLRLPPVRYSAAWTARNLAASSLDRARRLLSSGEVAVTDRLHGHLLASLHGIPHVVVDDRFGKIAALHSTWTRDLPQHEFAASWSEASSALQRLRERLAG